MSDIVEIIDTLETKIHKLLTKIDNLEQKNQELHKDLILSNKTIQDQNEQAQSLKKDFETLKLANSLLGSEDYKRDTKLKINSLIREIDYCIAQLSD